MLQRCHRREHRQSVRSKGRISNMPAFSRLVRAVFSKASHGHGHGPVKYTWQSEVRVLSEAATTLTAALQLSAVLS
jgi:hypothetical protein